jgi:hypothetical protein
MKAERRSRVELSVGVTIRGEEKGLFQTVIAKACK